MCVCVCVCVCVWTRGIMVIVEGAPSSNSGPGYFCSIFVSGVLFQN